MCIETHYCIKSSDVLYTHSLDTNDSYKPMQERKYHKP